MTNKISVTGATGLVGGGALRELASRGLDTRAAVRDPVKAAHVLPGGVELAVFDYERPDVGQRIRRREPRAPGRAGR